MKPSVQLMVYPDALGGDLPSLLRVLDKHLSQAVDLVHILPFYPSSGDRGFAPLTHSEVDPKFGTALDIRRIAQKYELMSDLISGHISTESVYYQDYLALGGESSYKDMFLPLTKVYPDGLISLAEIAGLNFLTPIPPFMNVTFADGSVIPHWKSFLPVQAELDVHSQMTRDLLESFAQALVDFGVSAVRLDAIATASKHRQQGFYLTEGFYEYVSWLVPMLKARGLQVLAEVTALNQELVDYMTNLGAYVYDFHLPPLILQTVLLGEPRCLISWLRRRKGKYISFITNHDGLVVDGFAEEVLPLLDQHQLRNRILDNAGASSREASGLVANNVSVRAINATLYEACFRDQSAWLLSQLILLFCPGPVQLYYNDLLSQRNDEDLYRKTGEGRSLVRHNHLMDQLDHKFGQPAVVELISAMTLRNQHPAFTGQFEIDFDQDGSELRMTYFQNEHRAELSVNLQKKTYAIQATPWK